jgi:hypothetical protein
VTGAEAGDAFEEFNGPALIGFPEAAAEIAAKLACAQDFDAVIGLLEGAAQVPGLGQGPRGIHKDGHHFELVH